ncbi:hypothetical protein MTO96_038439 [Rhipicephalus appendiculatus]
MQRLVLLIGSFLQFTIGTTVCESMAAAANIFLGMTEAPLVIRPFLSKMTLSELHTVMTSGFSTIAGSVMAAYISFGGSVWRRRAGTSDSSAPLVRNAAAVCGSADGNNEGLEWRGMGARPKDRRQIPPGLLSDSETDEEEATCVFQSRLQGTSSGSGHHKR